jgi:hypothetical protein
MAAPRGAAYTPKSGPLAGRTFVGTPGTTQAYNRYQQARARALGASSYSEERRIRQIPEYRALLQQEYHLGGRQNVAPQRRQQLFQVFAQNRRIETVESGGRIRQRVALDVDLTDHSVGGSLDRYLQAIGRRSGNEAWLPGETP